MLCEKLTVAGGGVLQLFPPLPLPPPPPWLPLPPLPAHPARSTARPRTHLVHAHLRPAVSIRRGVAVAQHRHERKIRGSLRARDGMPRRLCRRRHGLRADHAAPICLRPETKSRDGI